MLFGYDGKVGLLGDRPYGLQSSKYLPFGHLQENIWCLQDVVQTMQAGSQAHSEGCPWGWGRRLFSLVWHRASSSRSSAQTDPDHKVPAWRHSLATGDASDKKEIRKSVLHAHLHPRVPSKHWDMTAAVFLISTYRHSSVYDTNKTILGASAVM